MTHAPARLSLVTPTYNSEGFLAQTLESVRAQNLQGLEHVVMDGGSTDSTHAILERYRAQLSEIVIEPDLGQYDAINKGFARTSGDVMGWLNSDDVYLPSALSLVVSIFERFPQIDWLTTSKPVTIAASGEIIVVSDVLGFSREGFLNGENLPGADWPCTVFIQQESTFWRRSLWEKAGGGIDLDYWLAGDFHLWSQFFEHAELYALEVPVACFRRHTTQRSAVDFEGYVAEAKTVLNRMGGKPGKSTLRRLSIMLRRPGLEFLRKPLIKSGRVKGLPVVAYDWNGADWIIERR